MKVISFGHNMSANVRKELQERFAPEKVECLEIPFQIDFRSPLLPQAEKIVEHALEISTNDGQTPVVLLPGVTVAAVLIVAIIHGRTGQFPHVLEVVRKYGDDGITSVWRVKEVYNLNTIRNSAREKRFPIEGRKNAV